MTTITGSRATTTADYRKLVSEVLQRDRRLIELWEKHAAEPNATRHSKCLAKFGREWLNKTNT